MEQTSTLRRAGEIFLGVTLFIPAVAGAALADVAEAGANALTGRPQRARALPAVFEAFGELIFG